METPQIEDSTERQSAFPIGPCMYVRGGGLWAKHMGSKWGAIGNTLGGTPWEPRELIRNLKGTCWEQRKNEKRIKAFFECMLSLPIGCMKFLCSKTVRHHFWPRLIPPLWTGGTYLLWPVPITKPPPDLSMWCCAKTIFLSQTSTFWLFFMQFYSAGSHTEHSWGCCY